MRLSLVCLATAVLILPACGSSPPSTESVVRAWSQALNTDDNEQAANLFAPGAEVVQPGQVLTLRTHTEAVQWNAGLPCAGRIVSIESEGQTATATFELGSSGELALLGADPRNLSLLRLREYIRSLDQEGRDTARFRSLWHTRLADPFSVLLFAALAAPLGFAVERAKSLGPAAIQAVGLLGLYYALQTAASVVGSAGFAVATFAPWFVFGAFGAFGAWRLARVSS